MEIVEHLPPSGWGDVARKADLELVTSELRHLEGVVGMRFTHIDSRLRGIVAGMWAMGGIMSAFFVAILTKL